ncbi:hypothetical protein CHH83_01985 [Bacillus sp. 7586-K]|nr:hypothetical protein CHH83_01985 [Bacillus sp. 7586-K]
MGYGGDAHDYYREESLNKAVRTMMELGYDEKSLDKFETHELELMYERLKESKKRDYVDNLIEKLNGEQHK